MSKFCEWRHFSHVNRVFSIVWPSLSIKLLFVYMQGSLGRKSSYFSNDSSEFLNKLMDFRRKICSMETLKWVENICRFSIQIKAEYLLFWSVFLRFPRDFEKKWFFFCPMFVFCVDRLNDTQFYTIFDRMICIHDNCVMTLFLCFSASCNLIVYPVWHHNLDIWVFYAIDNTIFNV